MTGGPLGGQATAKFARGSPPIPAIAGRNPIPVVFLILTLVHVALHRPVVFPRLKGGLPDILLTLEQVAKPHGE